MVGRHSRVTAPGPAVAGEIEDAPIGNDKMTSTPAVIWPASSSRAPYPSAGV